MEDEQVGFVFRVSATLLAVSEVVRLLKNPPEDGISTLPPAKPKAGEIFIYKNDNSANGKTSANAWCGKGLALT